MNAADIQPGECPAWHNPTFNYDILASADVLRHLVVDEKLTDEQIGERAGCSQWTVKRWRHLFGIERPRPGSATVPRCEAMSRETFAQVVARVYARCAGHCWPGCPGYDECLDGECVL